MILSLFLALFNKFKDHIAFAYQCHSQSKYGMNKQLCSLNWFTWTYALFTIKHHILRCSSFPQVFETTLSLLYPFYGVLGCLGEFNLNAFNFLPLLFMIYTSLHGLVCLIWRRFNNNVKQTKTVNTCVKLLYSLLKGEKAPSFKLRLKWSWSRLRNGKPTNKDTSLNNKIWCDYRQ